MEKVTGKNQDNIPPHWAPMDLQELIVQELKANDPLTAEEYKNVSYKFLKTMANVEIVSIKRIQNRAMWDAYTVYVKKIGCLLFYIISDAHLKNSIH